MLSFLYLVVKTRQYFVTLSCMFLDEKTLLEIWLNPGLNLTIFQGTGPRTFLNQGCPDSAGTGNDSMKAKRNGFQEAKVRGGPIENFSPSN